ncbi:MAG TPA: MFS transporter [Vicinamibacterales bacterium]
MSLRSSRLTAVALVTLATFTDIVAYSIAIPVLPDFSRRLGASPTTIGILFGSFGITLLTVSIPMGAVSDRLGRRGPMIGGLVALAAATLLFAFATSLPWLFAARLVQGAADAITWVVGFAFIADLYAVEERGRMTGFVMSGTTLAVMIGPTIGGWLYEIGGLAVPFLAVTALAAAGAIAFAWIDPPRNRAPREIVPIGAVVRTPAIAACAVTVVAASGTISMMEPVLALHLQSLGIGPGRIGTLFGIGAIASTIAHPFIGRLADRFGAGRLTLAGLIASAVSVTLVSQTWSFQSAILFFMLGAVTSALMITPSLTFMGEATSAAGISSFGVAYGLYNMAWGVGLLSGPSLGGFLYDRMGFSRLALVWAPGLITVTVLLARVQSRNSPSLEQKERLWPTDGL